MNNNAIHILRTKLNNADYKVKNIVLSEGQPFFNITTNKLYIGDGTKKISELKYIGQEVDDSLQDFDNSHNNIENHDSGSRLKDSFNSCGPYKSFLYGYHLTATSDYQAIFGQYNDVSSTTPDNKTILAVGGGSSSERKNLFEVSSTASKFTTSLNVSVDPKKDGDVLRWGDLGAQQTNTGGTYLTSVNFNGKTLKYTKGSPTIPTLSVTNENEGNVITGISGTGHKLTITHGNINGSVKASANQYVSKVSFDGLTLKGETAAIPDVSVTSTGSGTFVTKITTKGHGIEYTLGNLKDVGSYTQPVFTTNNGVLTACSFSIAVDGLDYNEKKDIVFYVGA